MNANITPPGDSKPTRADALRNRELLLETAQRLFKEQGLEAVTMTAIAEAAGVGKGTLYRHFNNKAELAHAMLDQDMQDLQARLFRRLENQGDAVEDLRWFLVQIAHFVERNSALLCTVAGERGQTLLHAPAHLWWRQTIRGLLLRTGCAPDPDYAADVLYVMLDAQTIYFQKAHLGYDLPRILAGLDHTLSALLN
jgi:AcrR family transcriptional regulator